MEIKAGNYTFDDRNLKFEVVDAVNFGAEDTCYHLRGANGFGKTSFIEKMLIPALEAEHIGYLYIGQDIRTQLYTLRALLAVQGHSVFGADEYDILNLWITQNRTATFFILDEFDKYFSDYDFIFDGRHKFQTFVLVTHLCDLPMECRSRNYQVCTLNFEHTQFDGRLKNIRVIKEAGW